jgi:hypothetical protein
MRNRCRLMALVVTLSLVGCAARTTGTTSTPSTPYGIASKLADDVALSINQGDALVDAWRVQGILTSADERNILGWSNLANTVNIQYIACIRAVHLQSAAGGFSGCAKSLSSGLGDPATLTALHISNPKSQGNVTQIAQDIVGLVTGAITALGGN